MGDRVIRTCRVPRIALLLIALLVTACTERPPLPSVIPVTIADRVFRLETAMDPDTRKEGLSDRKDIAADGGMIFVFPSAEVQDFWMIRCNFPIDVIFLDGGGRVVSSSKMDVEPPETRNAPARTYSSHWPALFAIELKGSTLDSLGLKNGDKIDLPLAQLKASAR